MRRVVGLICGALVLAGCSVGNRQGQDELQVAATLTAATPAASPQLQRPPAGLVLPGDGPVRALLADEPTRTLIEALDGPPRLALRSLDAPQTAPKIVPLPAAAGSISTIQPGGPLLVPAGDRLLRVALPDGAVLGQAPVTGTPTSATFVGGRILTTVEAGGSVAVLDGSAPNPAPQRTITGFAGAAQVLPAGPAAVVLDQLKTSVTEIDPNTGAKLDALRAGDGATSAVPDRYGRILVVDTRDGELLAFSTNPLLMRQRYPVPGVPYGIAYDARRDLAWVTLTERNEVVGFAMAGGEPVEKYRVPTVRQPNAVAVDAHTGKVVVASGADGEVQVMTP